MGRFSQGFALGTDFSLQIRDSSTIVPSSRDTYESSLDFVSLICVYIVDNTDIMASSQNSRRVGQSGRASVLVGEDGKWQLKESFPHLCLLVQRDY